jgi:hypothetical protein
MSSPNPILDPDNARLQVTNLYGGTNFSQGRDSLDALPLGTADGTATGEIAVKTVLVGNSSVAATQAEAVTPSNSVDFTFGVSRAIYVGGAGNVTAVIGGVAVLFTGVLQGSVLPLSATRINSTGTTATSIVALK